MLSTKEKNQLFKATRSGNLPLVVELVEKGGTEQKNEFGWTPLMIAALWGHLNIVKFLLENNANLEAHAKMGITPIMIAALQKRYDVIDFLLNHQKSC